MEDRDILGKADALLHRHSVARPASGSDTGGVPVLTDLFDTAPAVPPADPVAREVFVRVMAELEGRIAADVERRVAQHLASQVQAAVASAIRGLQPEIAKAVEDAVNEALRARAVK